MDTEVVKPITKNDLIEKNPIVQEYEAVAESLQQDLKECKDEQARLITELNTLKFENKNAAEALREAFNNVNHTECSQSQEHREYVEHLEKQIAIIQSEKDSIFQLWQMSLKTADILEKENHSTPGTGRTPAHYEEQMTYIKETYSEAIKALQVKLVQVKENFEKHQALLNTARENISILNCEKTDLERQLANSKHELVSKESASQRTIEMLESNLKVAREDLDIHKIHKAKLENELMEMRIFSTKIVAKDHESKEKVAEVLELVEAAMTEKEIVLQREQRLIEEKSKLEARLAALSEEFASRLDKELTIARENYEKAVKKYILEIKETKLKLRETSTIVDRTQRERQLVEEELQQLKSQKVDSEYILHQPSSQIVDLATRLRNAEYQLQVSESYCKKYETKLQQAVHKISELEEMILSCNERVKVSEKNVSTDRETFSQVIEKIKSMEYNLLKAYGENGALSEQLKNLQKASTHEITRKNEEHELLESRLCELQVDLKKANDLAEKSNFRADRLSKQVESLEREILNHSTMKIDSSPTLDRDKSAYLKAIQEKYEDRMAELSEHVKVHQELSTKYKVHAESVAESFKSRYKELHATISTLKQENQKLKTELKSCHREMSKNQASIVQRFDQGDGA